MLGEIIVKIFTPTATPTATSTAATTPATSNAAANNQAADAQPASMQTSADSASISSSTSTSTSISAVSATAPSSPNAYDELLNSDIGTDDGTYAQLPSPIASAVEATKAGEAATSAITDVSVAAKSAPETVATASDVSKSVVATTAEVADVPLSVSRELDHASEQKSNEPSSSVSDIVSDAGNGVPLKIIGVDASSSGQTGSTTKLAEAVSSAGAVVKPTRQGEAAQTAHTSGSRAAGHSRPEIRISTAAKANSSNGDVSDAFKKSIQEQQKLAALQGTLGSDGKDGAGALFLLGRQSSQASSTADLVTILYGQH